ncbi:MAG: DUF975 domain-containing protein [Xenococcaceae cyanobacterium MO_207.B15]|nr:DUF975 domain-containing protein [Xenococcaceae cyanobacterium MO_207.B15]
MKSLTVGNVVSAGLRIYRDRFLEYFRIAFIGYLWVLSSFLITSLCFVPIFYRNIFPGVISIIIGLLGIFILIYGLAKFAAMNGLIARMAFGEVTEKPETEKEARRHIKPRMWQFLLASILVTLIVFFGFIVFYLILTIVSVIIGAIISSIISLGGDNFNAFGFVLLVLFGIFGFLFLLFALTWLISRYFIIELPLAVEDGITAGAALGRSWDLTKGSVIRLQIIVFVAFLISLPIIIVIQVVSTILQIVVGSLAASDNYLIYSLFSPLFSILILAISFAGGALLIPFWQAIKALIYYDLRVRREGLGMELEENN